jgi:hypothetical protein
MLWLSRCYGVIVTCVVDALQLFVSFVSVTTVVSSAQLKRKYVARVVVVGIVTVTVPVEVPPPATTPTLRVPVRSLSPVPFVVSRDR